MLVRLLPIKEQLNPYLTNLYRCHPAQSLLRVSNPSGQTLLQRLHRLVRLCLYSLYPEQCNRIRLPVGLSLSRYHHNHSPIYCLPKRWLLRQPSLIRLSRLRHLHQLSLIRQRPVLSCRVPKLLRQHLIHYRPRRVRWRQGQCCRDLNRVWLSQHLRRRKEGPRSYNNRDSLKGSIGKMRVLRSLWLWTTARPFAISWL